MLALIVCTLVFSLAMHSYAQGRSFRRYHQHLEQPSEAELGVCPVCGGEAELCTHLPIIRIETGGQMIPGRPIISGNHRIGFETTETGEEEIMIRWSAISEEGVWHHGDDEASQTGTAMFRIRGDSSRSFDKASFRLRLIREDNPELNDRQPLLGMAAGAEWALYGPFLDKTLMRNYMWMNIAGEVMEWAPNVRFCELILDGEYRGLYVLMEMIEVQKGRLDLRSYRPGTPVFSYLVRIESMTNADKTVDNFSHYTYRLEEGHQLELLYPGLKNQTQQVRDYVETDFSEAERMLYSAALVAGKDDWREIMDEDSLVDYYILEEFLADNDVFSKSTYFYRDARGKLCIGPVWDFNNVVNNFFQPLPEEEFILDRRGWYSQLMQDKDFVKRVIVRYRELRQSILSEERLLRYIGETEAWLGSAIDRNFEIWGYSFDPYTLSSDQIRRPEPGSDQTLEDMNPADYREAVKWMTDYLVDRGRWMDEHIEDLMQFCHPSKYSGYAK